MDSPWKLRILLLPVLAGFSATVAGQQLGLELGVEHFRWREYDGGERVLEETGPRYRLGGHVRWPLATGRSELELRGALYLGDIDYDGQACDSFGQNCVPFETEAAYRGGVLEALLVRRPPAASGLELFAGGGIDGWQRDIEGRGSVLGVVEEWTVFYLRAGAGALWTRNAVRYEARAGLKYPFYTYEFAEAFDVTLEPEGEVSYFARFAADFLDRGRPQWSAGVYYDSFRFDESDQEAIGGGLAVFQPESRQDTIGIYATIYLR